MSNALESFRFGVGQNGKVSAGGLDLGSEVRQHERVGDLAFWVWPGFKAWDGNYRPQAYEPTRYLIVRWLDDWRIKVVEEVTPGRYWFRERERMLKIVRGEADR